MMNAAVFKRTSLAMMMALALAACGGGGGGDDTPVTPTTHAATVSTTAGTADSRLACYKGNGEKACGLRMYQVMLEAYIDGDSNRDYDAGYGTSKHKGDLQGVINSLDYIKATGANAIWLTPIFQSTAIAGQDKWADKLDATGYFTSDYFSVDSQFGDLTTFKELVNKAHEKGLYVILDGVFGHFKGNLQASPTGRSPKRTTTCVGSGNSTFTAAANQACADFTDSNSVAFYKEVARYWIEETKIDGWRLDQAYQVPTTVWSTLKSEVESAAAGVTYTDSDGKSVNPLGYMVAEIWDGESNIAKNGYGTVDTPALSSAFDFPIRYRLVQTLAGEEESATSKKKDLPATTLNDGYNTLTAYPAHAMPNLMIGNHDLVRLGDLIQRANLGTTTDSAYWNRHKAAFAFMAAYSGPITLYYGDEIGQELPNYAAKVTTNCGEEGLCDDHVSRTAAYVDGLATDQSGDLFVMNATQSDLRSYVKQLFDLRDTHPALGNGARTHIFSDSNVYLDRKDAGTDHVLFVLNTKNIPAEITLSAAALGSAETATLTDLQDSSSVLTSAGGNYTITVPALTARFLSISE